MPNRTMIKSVVLGALVAAALPGAAGAAAPAVPAASLITAPLDVTQGRSLDYDAPLAMHAVSDAGALAAGTALEHLQLVLNRPAGRQAALDGLVRQQLDPASPSFHRWVDPSEFGAAFGPSRADVRQVTGWLQAEGFAVGQVSPNMMSIDFSGTAGQVARTFRTELHDVVNAAGEHHVANTSAPVIPAALGAVVHGVTLSNFFPRPALKQVGAVSRSGATGQWSVTQPAPGFTVPDGATTYFALTPSDFATIYNVNPARNGSPNIFNPATGAADYKLTGKGVTLIVAEQTNIRPADWNTFRSGFGLSGFAGTLKSVHPAGCADPGFTPDESEAALDAEWSSAVAPDATIIEASCAGTATTFGVMTTLQGLVNVGPRGSVISVSYGGCEVGNGLSFQAMWTQLVEQAAAEGISVFVSSGDSAAAGCDNANTATAAAGGLAVNGLASSAYVTAIGGTDFSDTADGVNGTYWSTANSKSDGSAKSYIPEIPWDDSCASSVVWTAAGATGAIPYCNQPKQPLLNIVGGGGGKSLYYSKPDWQSTGVLGVPNDHARGLPDVSLFASNGIWNHFYVYCMSDKKQGGIACNFSNVNDVLGSAAGGTSFSAPIFAGIEALVVQYKGGNVGLAAPRLYQLAQLQFGSPTLLNACKSNQGAKVSVACVFNEVTRGDDAVPCVSGSPNCFTDATSTAGIGVLSTSAGKLAPAYPESLGWNFATGLGSVNVTNLLINY